MTLKEFANMLNEAGRWLPEFTEIIKANMWSDDSHEPGHICHDDDNSLVIDSNMFGDEYITVEPNEYYVEFYNAAGDPSNDDMKRAFDTQEDAKNWAKQYIANCIDSTTRIVIYLFGAPVYDYSE